MDIDYNRYLNLQPGQARGGLPINYGSEPWRETERFEELPEFYRPAKEREDEYKLTIEIRDGQGRWLGNVEDYVEADVTWTSEVDATDASSFTLAGTSSWAKHFLRTNIQVCLVHFIVSRAGYIIKTWTGRVSRVGWSGSGPQSELKVECDHDKIWLKYMLAWPSPFMALNSQVPKRDMASGPAIWLMKQYCIKAAFRLQVPSSRLIFDLDQAIAAHEYQENEANWRNLQDFMHPVVVVPTKKTADTAPLTTLVAQMDTLAELSAECCKDYNILPNIYFFVPGRDVSPPGLFLSRPCVVIDFIDKDRSRTDPTYHDFWSNLTETARIYLRGLFGRYDMPPSLDATENTDYLKSFFGTDGQRYNVAWPIFRNSEQHWSQFEISAYAPTSTSSITGGKSNEFLNQGIKLVVRTLIQQALKLIGVAFDMFLSWLTGKLDDIFFAYQRAEDKEHRKFLGDFALFEDYGGKGSTAYSANAAQALRMQRYSAMGYKTANFTGDSASFLPFRIFEDFDVLDPVAWESPDGKIFPERVKQITLSSNRSNGVRFEIKLGETDRPEEPWAIQSRANARFTRAIESAFNSD